ncbi:MAG: hypothetical protein CMD65_03765 [Gammaproteobacteria bacterium]|nr:hypothetical protein [Gammaproteobacteria bacterium]
MFMTINRVYILIATLLIFLVNIFTANIVHAAEIQDRVVAVVNDGVILESELIEEVENISRGPKINEYYNLNDEQVIKKVLDKLILNNLLIQATKRFGINISDIALERGLRQIAQNENVPLPKLREIISSRGVDYSKYIEIIRNKMAVDELFRTQFYSRVYVTSGEIDNYIKNQMADFDKQIKYNLTEFVIVDENKKLNQKIVDDIYLELEKRKFNDIKDANKDINIEINELGENTIDVLPDLFVQALKKISKGKLSEIIVSPRGYHILKLNNVSNESQVFVTEYKVRHILMVTDVMTSEEIIKNKLLKIKNESKNIDDFILKAKQFSADKASGFKGGDIGWVRKESVVPEFSTVMIKTPMNKISEPFKTQYGWHILFTENVRTIDDTNTRLRKRAELAVKRIKADRQKNEWIAKLKDQAYIEIKDIKF